MNSLLFENPVPLLIAGVVLCAFLAGVYYTTRSTPAFVATMVVAVLTGGLLVVEQSVYTERELVEVTITDLLHAVEKNELPNVLLHLAPTADQPRALAEEWMPQLQVDKANLVSDIQVELDPQDPQRATARFRGFFRATAKKHGAVGAKLFPVEVQLSRGPNRWLVESFTADGELLSDLNQFAR